jgi:hypothetical protein
MGCIHGQRPEKGVKKERHEVSERGREVEIKLQKRASWEFFLDSENRSGESDPKRKPPNSTLYLPSFYLLIYLTGC